MGAGWKGTLEPPRAELKCSVLPKGISSLIPVSWGRFLHPFPSSCHHPILTEVAAVSASWGGGESLQRPPEGLELCPPQCPDSRTPPHSHLSSPPCPKSSVALCRGAVLCAVHPAMVWEAGMFCCHQKPALSGAALLQSSAPARCLPAVVLWGILQHSLGRGTKIPYSGFTAVCLALGQNWAQCGVPSAPSLECVGSSAVSPPRDSLCPLLPGCSCLAGGAEEHSAAAGL